MVHVQSPGRLLPPPPDLHYPNSGDSDDEGGGGDGSDGNSSDGTAIPSQAPYETQAYKTAFLDACVARGATEDKALEVYHRFLESQQRQADTDSSDDEAEGAEDEGRAPSPAAADEQDIAEGLSRLAFQPDEGTSSTLSESSRRAYQDYGNKPAPLPPSALPPPPPPPSSRPPPPIPPGRPSSDSSSKSPFYSSPIPSSTGASYNLQGDRPTFARPPFVPQQPVLIHGQRVASFTSVEQQQPLPAELHTNVSVQSLRSRIIASEYLLGRNDIPDDQRAKAQQDLKDAQSTLRHIVETSIHTQQHQHQQGDLPPPPRAQAQSLSFQDSERVASSSSQQQQPSPAQSPAQLQTNAVIQSLQNRIAGLEGILRRNDLSDDMRAKAQQELDVAQSSRQSSRQRVVQALMDTRGQQQTQAAIVPRDLQAEQRTAMAQREVEVRRPSPPAAWPWPPPAPQSSHPPPASLHQSQQSRSFPRARTRAPQHPPPAPSPPTSQVGAQIGRLAGRLRDSLHREPLAAAAERVTAASQTFLRSTSRGRDDGARSSPEPSLPSRIDSRGRFLQPSSTQSTSASTPSRQPIWSSEPDDEDSTYLPGYAPAQPFSTARARTTMRLSSQLEPASSSQPRTGRYDPRYASSQSFPFAGPSAPTPHQPVPAHYPTPYATTTPEPFSARTSQSLVRPMSSQVLPLDLGWGDEPSRGVPGLDDGRLPEDLLHAPSTYASSLSSQDWALLRGSYDYPPPPPPHADDAYDAYDASQPPSFAPNFQPENNVFTHTPAPTSAFPLPPEAYPDPSFLPNSYVPPPTQPPFFAPTSQPENNFFAPTSSHPPFFLSAVSAPSETSQYPPFLLAPSLPPPAPFSHAHGNDTQVPPIAFTSAIQQPPPPPSLPKLKKKRAPRTSAGGAGGPRKPAKEKWVPSDEFKALFKHEEHFSHEADGSWLCNYDECRRYNAPGSGTTRPRGKYKGDPGTWRLAAMRHIAGHLGLKGGKGGGTAENFGKLGQLGGDVAMDFIAKNVPLQQGVESNTNPSDDRWSSMATAVPSSAAGHSPYNSSGSSLSLSSPDSVPADSSPNSSLFDASPRPTLWRITDDYRWVVAESSYHCLYCPNREGVDVGRRREGVYKATGEYNHSAIDTRAREHTAKHHPRQESSASPPAAPNQPFPQPPPPHLFNQQPPPLAVSPDYGFATPSNNDIAVTGWTSSPQQFVSGNWLQYQGGGSGYERF